MVHVYGMATKQTDPQYKLRLPAELKERIERAALENKRSMNAEIVARLEASFEADASPPRESTEVLIDKITEKILAELLRRGVFQES